MAAVTLETSWSHIFCLESIQTDSSISAFVSICCTSPRAAWAAHHCQDWDVVGSCPSPCLLGFCPGHCCGNEAGGCSLCFCSFPIFHVPLCFYLMLLLGKYLWRCYGGEPLIRGSGGFMYTIFFQLFLHYFFLQKKRRVTVWRKKKFSSGIEMCQFSRLPNYLRGRKHAWRISRAVMLPGRRDLEKLGFDNPGCSTVSFRNTVSSSHSLLIAMWENGLLTVGQVFSLFLMLPFISKHCSISLSAAWPNSCWRPWKNSWDPYTAGQQEPKHGF